MKHETKQYAVLALVIAVIAVGAFFLKQRENNQAGVETKAADSLFPVDSISHGHGLAVDVNDSDKLYIATHYGLFVLKNDTDLYRIGQSQDDFMGFSVHPTESNILFTSGHPMRGGNLGVQKSEDGGVTWTKISNGQRGPVDFHAMAVSTANPDILYGWYNRALQRSEDGGYNWEIVDTAVSQVISLVTDPQDENKVYAATSEGVLVSADKGESWTQLADELQEHMVTVLAIHPENNQVMFSFSGSLGMAQSTDGGASWNRVDFDFGGDTVLYVAFDRQNPDTIYTMTRGSAIYKTNDLGSSWDKVI